LADASRDTGKQQATIRFINKLLASPLLKTILLKDPLLKNLLVIRAPNATNFKVTPEEWQQVHELLKEST
jgi:predicted RNA-binding protein with PUA-like domain